MNEMGIRVISAILMVLILVAVIAFSKWKELIKEKKLRQLIAWSVTTNYQHIGSVRPGLDLIDYINEVAYNHILPKHYCISEGDERELAKDILKEYQRVLTQEYFNGELSLTEAKYTDEGKHFFFAHLFNFLQKHKCDDKFIGKEMHSKLLSHKRYGKSFTSGSESTYSLSTLGIVFYKLYYISYLFCKDSSIYGKSILSGIDSTSFTDILDSAEITICWYRL